MTALRQLLVFGLLLASVGSLRASVVNDDFSQPLSTGWTTQGSVALDNEHAVLSDAPSAFPTRLYQGVALATGAYSIRFDFLNDLSADVDTGFFPDSFFASLYYTNDMGTFDLDGAGPFTATDMLDLQNASSDLFDGSISTLADPGWFRYTLNFTNNFNFVIPTFEFFDLNGFEQDSVVRIDNVVISERGRQEPIVPEPATMALIGLGLGGLSLLRRSRLPRS